MSGFTGNLQTTLRRREELRRCVDDLWGAVNGGNAKISSVIGAGRAYSEAAAQQLVDEIVGAYSSFPVLEEGMLTRQMSEASYLKSWERRVERKQIPKLLDETQESLVRSMLYCLIRLLAFSPFFKYDRSDGGGSFDNLKHECGVLLESFSHGIKKEEFWREDVKSYVLSGGAAHRPEDLAAASSSLLFDMMPILGADGIIGWSGECPTFFLDDLDMIYEILSGKHIAKSIPAKRRRKIIANADFSYLKEDARLGQLSDEQAQAVLDQGLISQEDFDAGAELKANMAGGRSWLGSPDDALQTPDAKAVLRWAAEFPAKGAWCKNYRAMREAYFKLEGIRPLGSDSSDSARFDPRAINHSYLVGAIDAVLSQRGISLISSDAYTQVYKSINHARLLARKARNGGR